MDERLFLIRTKNKNETAFKDNTGNIAKIRDKGRYYGICFNKGYRELDYLKENVEYYDAPKPMDIATSLVQIRGGKPIVCDAAIIFADHVCLFHRNFKYPAEKLSDVTFIDNIAKQPNAKQLIEYYHYIVSLLKKDATEHLSRFYQDKLQFIQPSAIANHFINQIPPKKYPTGKTPIFPFGINLSQRKAVFNALGSQVSLIQGPPGTGKTQTILNIIANLVMMGKSLAIVAGNNSAVANVYEKLEKENMAFIAAKLGNATLSKAFFTSDNSIPELGGWHLTTAQTNHYQAQLEQLNERITTLLENRNRLAQVTEALNRLNVEKQYFERHFAIEAINISRWSVLNSWATPNLIRFMVELQQAAADEKLGWLTKFSWLFKFGIYKFDEFERLDDVLFKGVVSEYYQTKAIELESERQQLSQTLSSESYELLLKQHSHYSLKLLKGYLAQRFGRINDEVFQYGTYRRQREFEQFQQRFPVVLSTTDSIINNKSEASLFDYLIVDEASQVNLLTALLAMNCASNIVVVGDVKQLPHISDEDICVNHSEIVQRFNVQAGFNYEHDSLLSSFAYLFKDKAPTVLLKEHYRCHPRIIDFCNQKFYNGELIIMTDGKDDPFKIVKTSPGNHARSPDNNQRGLINQRELDVIEQEVLAEELIHTTIENIGIVTPYREQANRAVKHFNCADLLINTVHKYQGRERDSIVFGTTANELKTFIDQPKLLNVAVSRAKKRFVMVTSQNTFKQQGSNVGDLIRHIEYQSMLSCIFESNVISIFDCLYKDFSPRLLPFLRKVKEVSEFQSEDLMATLLDELLQQDKFNSFSYQRNYVLSLAVKNYVGLDSAERKFAANTSSHLDFYLYNKLDMQPLLAIEVDGYEYHQRSEAQKRRDALKNSIMAKKHIPLLRFSTIGSGEKFKLEQELNALIEALPD